VSAPFLIGLTGGIGSGKSTVAAELAELGAEIVSGDELGRRALEGSPDFLAQIRSRFGNDVFDSDGKLVRRKLGDKVFGDAEKVLWLTRASFPGIHAFWLEAVERSQREVVVFDAALIFEWGIEKEFDLLVVVQSALEDVVSRSLEAARLSRREVEARLTSQIPPATKAERADVVLVNDGSLDEFRQKIREFWATRVVPELNNRREKAHGSSC
jgi:dephospho-CoA kinase